MDLTLEQVRYLLISFGISIARFSRESRKMSGKTWADLEKEYRDHEVRFVLDTEGRIVCYRQTGRVLAINKWFKYVEIGRLFVINGNLVFIEKEQNYTLSETVQIDLSKPLDEIERPIDAVVWAGFEEMNVKYRASDLRTEFDQLERFEIRKSETFYGLFSCNLVSRFRINPRKMLLYKEYTPLLDTSGSTPFVRIIKRVATKPREFEEY